MRDGAVRERTAWARWWCRAHAVRVSSCVFGGVPRLAEHEDHCTTDHTKVAVPETPSVSVAVTVTV